jgi:hypothetical protein
MHQTGFVLSFIHAHPLINLSVGMTVDIKANIKALVDADSFDTNTRPMMLQNMIDEKHSVAMYTFIVCCYIYIINILYSCYQDPFDACRHLIYSSINESVVQGMVAWCIHYKDNCELRTSPSNGSTLKQLSATFARLELHDADAYIAACNMLYQHKVGADLPITADVFVGNHLFWFT